MKTYRMQTKRAWNVTGLCICGFMLFSQACFDCLSQKVIWHNGCWQKTGQVTDRQTFVSRVSINIETLSCINPGSTTKYQHQLILKSGDERKQGLPTNLWTSSMVVGIIVEYSRNESITNLLKKLCLSCAHLSLSIDYCEPTKYTHF